MATTLTHQIRVRHLRNDEYGIRLRGHELHTDQPEHDQGMSPAELFVASLAASAAHFAGRFLLRHNLSRSGLTVIVRYGLAHNGRPRIAAVRLSVHTGHLLDTRRRAALHRVVDHCTVHNTLQDPPEIEIRVDEGGPG